MRSTKRFSLRHVWLAAFISVLAFEHGALGDPPTDLPTNRLRIGVGPSTSGEAELTVAQTPIAKAEPERPADTSASNSGSRAADSPPPVSGSASPPVPDQLPETPLSPAPTSPAEAAAISLTAKQSPPESPPADQPAEEPLKPIPDAGEAGPLKVHPASFKSITPGVSTSADVQTKWGAPVEISRQNGLVLELFRVDPFERVEVVLSDDKVASIVIRLERAFPADMVAQQLELSKVRPVLVSNELGEILGQAFPERGVLFAFEPSDAPGKATMKVVQIILEPITAEPFLLRAETLLDSQPSGSLQDLDQAIKVAPENARAHWLRARVLAATGDAASALASAEQSVRLEPDNSRYLVTQGQILASLSRYADAVPVVEKAAKLSGDRPHVKARALCMLGDLYGSGPQPDYKKAMEYHGEAIKAADPLAVDRHPAVRLAAKEVLIDAHLGAAHDIAWGNWNQKEASVPRWLKRAAAFAEEMIENDGGTPEHRLRIATRALAASVGMQGKLDPTEWAEETIRVGQQLIDSADDSQKPRHQWDVGMALYDAVQVYQLREENDTALKYGEQAVGRLEKALAARGDNPTDRYLLGRLYFRLGAIHAVGSQNHPSAITWFEKAAPLLEALSPQVNPNELGRLGETFVSMGVSYWETGKRDRAVSLTQRGVELMEAAVKNGAIRDSALEIPYGNLASMHRQLGQMDMAGTFLQKASRISGAVQR